jgi:AraC family transcriptional regulator, transcriptional activator of pobA
MFVTYRIAHFLNTPKKNIYFHIDKLEYTPPAQNIVRPHKHEFHEVFLIKKGQVHHSVDHQDFTIGENTLFFISQGQLHQWMRNNAAFEGYRLMFTEEFLIFNQQNKNILFELIYLDNIHQHPFLHVPEDTVHQFFACFDLLFDEYHQKQINEDGLRALLHVLLIKIQRLFSDKKTLLPTNKHDIALYKQFISLLESYYTKNYSIGEYAQKLLVSERNLNRMVRAVANQSPSAMIQNRIILEAKRQLTYSDLSIGQISELLGFKDISYFARYFRKATQLSPTEFKTNVSEKYRNMA